MASSKLVHICPCELSCDGAKVVNISSYQTKTTTKGIKSSYDEEQVGNRDISGKQSVGIKVDYTTGRTPSIASSIISFTSKPFNVSNLLSVNLTKNERYQKEFNLLVPKTNRQKINSVTESSNVSLLIDLLTTDLQPNKSSMGLKSKVSTSPSTPIQIINVLPKKMKLSDDNTSIINHVFSSNSNETTLPSPTKIIKPTLHPLL